MALKIDLKTEAKALADLISKVRKAPHNFAMLIGKDGLVVEADRKKSPDMMRRAAKANGGGSKGAWGVMKINGKVVSLECEAEPPGNFVQIAKKHFAERGQPLRFEILFGPLETPAEEAPKPEPTERARRQENVEEAPEPTPPVTEMSAEDALDEEDGPEDLKAIIAGARKRPYNFACLLGKEAPVLKAHLRKPVGLLVKQAKAEGASARGGWGRLSVEGKLVVLRCEEDPPQVLARALKVHMRSQGVQMGVKILSPSGETLEPEGDEAPVAAPDFTQMLQAGAHFVHLLDKGPSKKLDMLTKKLQGAVDGGQLVAAGKIATLMEATLPTGWASDLPLHSEQPETPNGAPKLTKQLPAAATEPLPEELMDARLQAPKSRGYPRRFKVAQVMDNVELSILIDMEMQGITRAEAADFNKDPAMRVHPLDFTVTEEHVAQGFVTIIISDPGRRELTEASLDEAQASFDAMDGAARDRINAATDAAFSKATGFPEGQKLQKGDPNFEAYAEAWMGFRADQLKIQTHMAQVPPRILAMFEFSENGVDITPAIARELAIIADKLSVLSDEELALFWDGLTRKTDQIALFSKSVDRFLQERHERTEMGGGPREFASGDATGTVIAKLRDIDITAENRETRDFGSKDQAIAFARSLKKGAAVMIEDGRYVVYQVDLNSLPLIGADLDLDDAEISFTETDPNDSWVERQADNLVAVITDDDYVLDTDDSYTAMAEINRVGGTLGPYDGHIQAFGPGLKLIEDRKTFENQFELVMRDATYDALNKAEGAAQAAKTKFKHTMGEDDKALATKVLDDLAPINEELSRKEHELLVAKATLYAGYAERFGNITNPFSIPSSMLVDFITKGTLVDTQDAERAKVKELQKEVAMLHAQRTAAAAEFPLALRIEDPDAFKAANGEDSAAMIRKICDGVLASVRQTRDNVDDGDFNFWTMADVAGTAMASTGLKGEQLQWAQDRMRAEGIEDMVWAGGEAVVTIGLAVGAIFASGGTALLLGGAAVVVGGASAVNVTEEYFRKGSAANIALDPSQGLLSPDEVPHWGWVVAAWVGVGLDVAGIGPMRKALDLLKSAKELTETSPKVVQAAKLLNTTPEALLATLKGRQVSSLSVGVMGEAVFDASFGRTASEAATVITKNADGGFDAQILVRAGADPAVRELAVAEELRHLAQLNDPKFADDVALITEDALSNWATKHPMDKLRAARARLRLEADSQATALEQMRKRLGDNPDEALEAQLNFQIDELEGSLARYMRELDEVEAGIKSGEVPSGVDLTHPTRLFNSPNYLSLREELLLPENAAVKSAIEDFFSKSETLERSHYYLTKKNGKWGLHRSRKAPADAPTLHINAGESGAEVVVSSRRTVAETRAEIMKEYGAASTIDGFEDAISALEIPYHKAYARKFGDSLDVLKKLGGGDGSRSAETIVQKVIAEQGGDAAKISDSAFETAFRREMRDQMTQALAKLDGPERGTALKSLLDSMPDNASKGALFAEYRRMSIRDAKLLAGPDDEILDMSLVSRTQGDLKFTKDGESFMGDGIIATPDDFVPPGGSGPKLADANYMVEDKSSFGAFDLKQFTRYAEMIKDGGSITTSNGKVMRGVTYFFPDRTAAAKVLKAVRDKVSIPDNMHIGYYDADGKLAWLK